VKIEKVLLTCGVGVTEGFDVDDGENVEVEKVECEGWLAVWIGASVTEGVCVTSGLGETGVVLTEGEGGRVVVVGLVTLGFGEVVPVIGLEIVGVKVEVGVGEGAGEGVDDGEGEGVNVGRGDGDGVGEGAGEGVDDGEGEGVNVGRGDGDGEGLGLAVGGGVGFDPLEREIDDLMV
jgi:hypothetical protein